jgi:hypothetical protein
VIRRHRTLRAVVALTAVLASSCAIAAAAGWTTSLTGGAGATRSKAAPSAPASPAAICVSSSGRTVRISWTAVAGATSYTVYDSTNGYTGPYASYATGLSSSPYTTSNLPSGTYYFKVAAVFGSNWVGAQTSATAGRQIQNSNPNCQ